MNSNSIETTPSNAAEKTIEVIVSLAMFIGLTLAMHVLYLPNMNLPWYVHALILVLLAWLASQSGILILFSMLLTSLLVRPKSVLDEDVGYLAVFVVGTIMMIAWILRYNDVRRYVVRWLIDREQDRSSVFVPSTAWLKAWALVVARAALFVIQCLSIFVIAIALIRFQPWINDSPLFRWALSSKQALWPGALWIVVALFFLIVIHEGSWRLLSDEQKQLYLKVVSMKAVYSDLRRIVRLRNRQT